jgi:protein gp37
MRKAQWETVTWNPWHGSQEVRPIIGAECCYAARFASGTPSQTSERERSDGNQD